MQIIDRGRRLASVLLLTALAACSDATGPDADPPTAAPIALRPSASYSGVDSYLGTITLWDAEGVAYTLDGRAGTIRASDGTIIVLTPSEVATAVNAFTFAYEGDQLAYRLATSPPPPAYDECVYGGDTCYRNDIMGTQPGVSPPPAVEAFFADEDVASVTQWTCNSMAIAIYAATVEHRRRRADVEGLLRGIRILRPSMSQDGVRLRLVDLGDIARRFEVAAAMQAQSTIQLNILAGMYRTYGCAGGDWPGSVGSTFVPTMPGIVKNCRSDVYEIELADGTKVTREVTVCDTRMQ